MIRRTRFRSALAAGLALLFSLPAHAAGVKIVANVSVKANSISPRELRGVFLAERNSLDDGSHVQPVFQREGQTHADFLRDLLKESSESLAMRFGALVFTGKASMPKTFNSEAEVLAYVAKTRGAIGYVSPGAATAGVKVLELTSESARPERVLLTRVEPEYPPTLRALAIGGAVRLRFTISPKGKVENISVAGGNPILGEAAVKAVQQWIYSVSPAATPMEITVPFDPHTSQ